MPIYLRPLLDSAPTSMSSEFISHMVSQRCDLDCLYLRPFGLVASRFWVIVLIFDIFRRWVLVCGRPPLWSACPFWGRAVWYSVPWRFLARFLTISYLGQRVYHHSRCCGCLCLPLLAE